MAALPRSWSVERNRTTATSAIAKKTRSHSAAAVVALERSPRTAVQQFTSSASHLLRVLALVVLVHIVVVVIIILVFFLLGLFCRFIRLLGVVLLLLLRLLDLAQSLPLLQERVALCLVVCDDNVVEDGAALPLPQVEA